MRAKRLLDDCSGVLHQCLPAHPHNIHSTTSAKAYEPTRALTYVHDHDSKRSSVSTYVTRYARLPDDSATYTSSSSSSSSWWPRVCVFAFECTRATAFKKRRRVPPHARSAAALGQRRRLSRLRSRGRGGSSAKRAPLGVARAAQITDGAYSQSTKYGLHEAVDLRAATGVVDAQGAARTACLVLAGVPVVAGDDQGARVPREELGHPGGHKATTCRPGAPANEPTDAPPDARCSPPTPQTSSVSNCPEDGSDVPPLPDRCSTPDPDAIPAVDVPSTSAPELAAHLYRCRSEARTDGTPTRALPMLYPRRSLTRGPTTILPAIPRGLAQRPKYFSWRPTVATTRPRPVSSDRGWKSPGKLEANHTFGRTQPQTTNN